MVSSEVLNNLNDIVKDICTERHDYKSLAEWGRIKEVYDEELPRLRESVQKLGEQVRQFAEPPLHYAVYLGPCTSDQRYLVVGVGGTRIEVRSAEEAGISSEVLTEGQLVVLNKEQNIVDVRHAYVCGETAEVINVLKEDEEAEVLLVIEGASQQAGKLRVKWRENEEIEVACSQELGRMTVQRGDIVRIDPDNKIAIARAKPRLHVKVGGNEGTVVEISNSLAAQGVQIGDIVRVETGLKFAFEKLPAYETGKLTLEEVPDVTYEDIGGLNDQIGRIYDAIELPYLYREQFERYQLVRPKGILLYGPPGCGKTMIAKAVANSLTANIRSHLTSLERLILLYKSYQQAPDDPTLLTQYRTLYSAKQRADSEPVDERDDGIVAELAQRLQQNDLNLDALDEELQKLRSVLAKPDGIRSFFLNVKGPELLDKYVGETEHRIRKIFEEARRHSSYYTPVIIFFDEMEAMFRTRGSGLSSDIETTIVPQFLSEIDGVESIENLVIIGASNRQDMIDPAILRPGRLDVKIKIGRPSRKSAQDIFAMYLLPTLPLNGEGLLLPDTSIKRSGEIVFRTAYHTTPTTQHHPHTEAATPATIDELLPTACDLRLAFSLSDADLQVLSELPPELTVREVLTNAREEKFPRAIVQSFKGDLEVGVLVTKLRTLFEHYHNDRVLQQRVVECIKQEWIAEVLLLQAIEILYNSVSTISALTDDGTRYTFPLQDFMSGATIANIVTRAKRQAIKRVLLEQASSINGICWQDLLDAIHQEFAENQEQFARQKLNELGKVNADIQSVEVNIEAGEVDPWSEEKLQLHRLTAPLVI